VIFNLTIITSHQSSYFNPCWTKRTILLQMVHKI